MSKYTDPYHCVECNAELDNRFATMVIRDPKDKAKSRVARYEIKCKKCGEVNYRYQGEEKQ